MLTSVVNFVRQFSKQGKEFVAGGVRILIPQRTRREEWLAHVTTVKSQCSAGLVQTFGEWGTMQYICDEALPVFPLIVLLEFPWSLNGNSFQPSPKESVFMQIRNHIYWKVSIRKDC
ncbi:hypothetical protein TNCV_1524211 [Trichonephila clavipes]|nr:hypothetical protein TNCV_1524211 [Trichonephila clavipes]